MDESHTRKLHGPMVCVAASMSLRRLRRLALVAAASVAALAATQAPPSAVASPDNGGPRALAATGQTQRYRTHAAEIEKDYRRFLDEFETLAVGEAHTVQAACAEAEELERDPETKAAAETVWQSVSLGAGDTIHGSVKDFLEPRLLKVRHDVYRLRADAVNIWGSHARQMITFDSAEDQVLTGASLWNDALDQVLNAVTSWTSHECAAATAHLTSANTILKNGNHHLATGIRRLKALS